MNSQEEKWISDTGKSFPNADEPFGYNEASKNSSASTQTTIENLLSVSLEEAISAKPYTYDNITGVDSFDTTKPKIYGNTETHTKYIDSWVSYSSIYPNQRITGEFRRQPTALPYKGYSLDSVVTIHSVLAINPALDNTFDGLYIEYSANYVLKKIIVPYQQFQSKKLLDCFIGVCKSSKHSVKTANEYLYELICSVRWKFIAIPSLPGWKWVTVDGINQQFRYILFASNHVLNPRLLEFMPDAVRKRKLFDHYPSGEKIIWNCEKALPASGTLNIVFILRITSLFLSWFAVQGIFSKQIFILESSESADADILTAMIKTEDYESLQTHSLSLSRKECFNELNSVNDGTIVFRDTLSDRERKLHSDSLKCIHDFVQNTSGKETYAENFITVISSDVSKWLPSEKVLCLSFENKEIEIGCNAVMLQNIMGEFDSFLINYVKINIKIFQEFFIKNMKEIPQTFPENLPEDRKNLYIMMMFVFNFMNQIFLKPMFSDKDKDAMIEFLCEKNDANTYQRIQNDFISAVNECIRNRKIKIVDRKKNQFFEKHTHTAVAMDNILGFEPETIQEIIIPMMQHTVAFSNLINALVDGKILYAPEKNHHNRRHSIQMKDAEGKPNEIHVYSIDRNVLAENVRQRIDNLSQAAFLLERDEIPEEDFLPMIQCDGRIVGKLMRYKDEEDNSIFISGQMNAGKSYALIQRAVFLKELGHRVIIFDAKGSFTRERLCDALTEDSEELPFRFYDAAFLKGIGHGIIPSDTEGLFIPEKVWNQLTKDSEGKSVGFHNYNIERVGIPVDLFHLERKNRNTDTSILEKILSAGVGTLSKIQLKTLRKAASDLLTVVNPNENLQIEDILKMLDEKGPYSVHAQLEQLFSELSKLESPFYSTWEEFFKAHNGIIIFSIKPVAGQINSQFFDMILASLYQFQSSYFSIPLHIIIDEIRSQNVSQNSPLWSVVAEGRKFHMSVSCADQEYIASRNDRVGGLTGKFRNKIIMSPTTDSETAAAGILGYGNRKRRVFDAMEQGDCIVKLFCYNKEKRCNQYVTISGKICSYRDYQSFMKDKKTE